jgi:hypothetical protein
MCFQILLSLLPLLTAPQQDFVTRPLSSSFGGADLQPVDMDFDGDVDLLSSTR